MFKSDVTRTPKQRAERALMNIIARLGGCGFLIYFVVKVMTAPAESKPDPTTTAIISIVFLLVSALVIFITVLDLVKGFRLGRFKASTYEEQDIAEYLEKQKSTPSGCDCEDGQQELDAHQDDAVPTADDKEEDE